MQRSSQSIASLAAALHLQKIKTDGAGFGAPGADTVADGLLGILWHQALKFGLGSLVLEKGTAGRAEYAGELGPRIGRAHINDPNSLDSGVRWLDAKEARGLAALDAAPELTFRRDNEMLIERIGMGLDLNPLAAASND